LREAEFNQRAAFAAAAELWWKDAGFDELLVY
jgi:hypothetical protein